MFLNSTEITSRLISDLRLGLPILLYDEEHSVLVAAIETLYSEKLKKINQITKNLKLWNFRDVEIISQTSHSKIALKEA